MEKTTPEKIYKQTNEITNQGGEMTKVLISTIFGSVDPIMSIATKIGIDRIILIVDEKPSEKQEKTIELLKKSLGNVIDIKTIKTKVYDIVKVAEDVVKTVDVLSTLCLLKSTANPYSLNLSSLSLYSEPCAAKSITLLISSSKIII